MSVETVTSKASSDAIDQVGKLLGKGLCAQALQSAESIAPLRQWNFSAAARVLAGRLAQNLGAPRLGAVMQYRAWREFPDDPQAIYFYSRLILERRGPLPAWEFIKSIGDLPHAPPHIRADWFAHRADVARMFRDFDVAESWLNRAVELAPQRPWIWIERASLLESEDRYDECLAAARKAMELGPGYRSAVQMAAHALQLLDRDEEALELLQQSAATTENMPILTQLAMLQYELQRYPDADATLQRCETLSPLIEKKFSQWISSRRSDVAAALGNFDEAVEFAKLADNPFHKKIAENLSLAENRSAKRVLLPVGFVRQHHMTCAPATLAAISQFWSMPADHLAVVEAICYDGTPHHSERNWAQTHDWETREFTVTWEAAVALIDRGVPFTLTTVDPGNAHMQAVVGYDARRRTLLVRDPYFYYVIEMMGELMLERHRSTGPRGMALVPSDRAHLLDGIELKDSHLWNLNHAVQSSLQKHDREAASAAAAELIAADAEHFLASNANRALAAYDADSVAALAAVEKLLQSFPDDANLLLNKLSYLNTLGRREEHMTILSELCGKKDCDPLFWEMYAHDLERDDRQQKLAERLCRQVIRRRPRSAASYALLGNILWDRGRRDDAAELYRFSACMEEMREHFSRSYFIASRHLKQTSAALDHLRRRFERFGKRSGAAIHTLFWALEEVDQNEQAFALLDHAVELRPDDGDLLIYAAIGNARYGRFDVAQKLLDRAADKCSQIALHRGRAELASLRGDLQQARDLWREVCEEEPLNVDAHGRLARLLAETQSTAAAIEHLRAASARFPRHYGLKQLLLNWLRDESSPQEIEPVIRELVESFPDDVWAHRELAIMLLRQRRIDEAMSELETARRINPTDAHTYSLIGRAHLDAQRTAEARDAFREAIHLSVDNDSAIGGLLDACDTTEQKRQALAFVRDELRRQTIFGDGLLAYRNRAAQVLDHGEVMISLREALDARPDLWHAHSALIQELIAMNQLDEAAKAAAAATERFPLLPRMWLDLAQVHRARRDDAAELSALEKAVQLAPGFSYATRELAEVHRRQGNSARAQTLLEQSIARAPLDPYGHGCLADLLWKMDRKEEAIESARRGVKLLPDYAWGWSALRRWVVEVKRPQLLEQIAREVAAQRPGEARSWLILAENLTATEQFNERLAAIDRAIALAPRMIAAYQLRVWLLAGAGKREEALLACRPAIFAGETPVQLREQAARILWSANQREEAIKEMSGVVADSPQDRAAWFALLDWHRAGKNHPAYLNAAKRVAELFPRDENAFGYLGEAHQRNKQAFDAKTAFARAVELDSGYVFAAMSLVDLQLLDDLPAAEALLKKLRAAGKIAAEIIVARQVQLTTKGNIPAAAGEKLLELCMLQFKDVSVLQRAVQYMERVGWGPQIGQMLRAASQQAGVNPLVGHVWMEQMTKAGLWSGGYKLLTELMQAGGELSIHAAERFLGDAAEKGQRRLVLKTMRRHREVLHRNILTWGAGGYALTRLKLHRRAVKWMADWNERPDAGQWMLNNLIFCLHRLGKADWASQVTQRALSLTADGTINHLRIWAAWDRVRAADLAAAASELQKIDPAKIDPYYRFMHQILTALCIADSIDDANRVEKLKQVRVHIQNAEVSVSNHGKTPELRKMRRLTLWMVRQRCGFKTPAWCWGRLAGIVRSLPMKKPVAQSVKQSMNLNYVILVIVIIVVIALLNSLSHH